jgi:hypothetical protein
MTEIANVPVHPAVSLTLTHTECQQLAGLLDLALKAAGLRVVKDVAALADKLDSAMQAAQSTEE